MVRLSEKKYQEVFYIIMVVIDYKTVEMATRNNGFHSKSIIMQLN